MGRSCLYFVSDLVRGEEAATAVEYAVMLAMILIGIISAITSFGGGTGGLYSNIGSELNATPFGS